jgi:drug/metabolite transporter (DMT)-like permease
MREEAPPRLILGIVICLVAYLFAVTASSLVWNFQDRFSTIQIIFIQNVVSFLCIAPIALRKGFGYLKTNFLADHLMRDLFGVGSYYLYFLAIRYLNLVDATVLNYTAPFFVPIFWWIWMKEKVRGNVWWSIIIGFIGVAVILNPTRQIFQLGFLYGVFAGLASAVAFCSIRILNLHHEPMSRVLFYYLSFGSLITMPFAIVSWTPPTPTEWLQCIGIGVATALLQMLLTIAYRYGTASYLSPLGYSTVVYAGISSWLIFDKPISLRSWIGTALIIIGGTATYLLKKQPESLSQTFEHPDPKEKPPL